MGSPRRGSKRPTAIKACRACVNSQIFGIFSKQVAQSIAELLLYSQKYEMWSFSIKFGGLRYKNVNNTFMNFTLKHSQPHTRLASLDRRN